MVKPRFVYRKNEFWDNPQNYCKMCSEPVSSVPCSATEEWALPFHHYSLLNNKREILLSITTVSPPSCLHTHAPLRALPPQPSLPRVLGRCFLVPFGAGSCLPALSWCCSQPAGVIFHPCCGMGPRGKMGSTCLPSLFIPSFCSQFTGKLGISSSFLGKAGTPLHLWENRSRSRNEKKSRFSCSGSLGGIKEPQSNLLH